MTIGTILYVGGFELPDKNAAAHRVLANGKIMRELGYDVIFIGVDKTLSKEVPILETQKNIQGFKTWSVPYPKKITEWISYLMNIKYIMNFSQIYDIDGIVAYNYPSIGLQKLKKFGKKENIKIYSDCTEWYVPKEQNFLFNIIKTADSEYRMRVVQKKLDGIIVISNFLENYYLNCRNVVKIPPLIDINEEKWNNISQKNEIDNENISLIYAGSPGRDKDILTKIFEAINMLDKRNIIKINVIGITKSQFITDNPEFEEILDSLDNKVTFLGRKSHQESLEEIQKSDYSIFIREKNKVTQAGFPTKFTESITCSTPVITTEVSDVGEYIINKNYGYLLKSSNVNEIYNILHKINALGKRKVYGEVIDNKIFHYSNYSYLLEDFLLKKSSKGD